MNAFKRISNAKLITLRLLLLIALLGSLSLDNLKIAWAQPAFPMLFAGTVKIIKAGATPIDAPIGTVVSAKAGGVPVGSITVTEAGKYGAPPFSFLLTQGNLVPGIVFYINDVQVTQPIVSYNSGAPPNTEFPLTVEDNTPPVISGMQPDNGSSTTITSVTISASYSDALAGVNVNSGISLLLNNLAISPDTKTASGLSYSTNLTPNTYTVTLSVSDNIGNTATQTWSFTITNPVVTLPPSSSPPVSNPPPVFTPIPTPPVIPVPTAVIPVPTPVTPPVIVTPPSPVDAIKFIIESKPPRDAVAELGQLPAPQIVQALQQTPVDKASQFVAELPTSKATEVINTVAVDKAAELVGAMNTNKAAEIITQATTTRAVEIAEKAPVTRTARILEQVTADKAAQIIGQVSSVKAGDILANMSPDKAGLAMDKLVPGKLEQVLPAMDARAIQARLPEVSPAKQYEIRPETIFRLLPQAPTEQLVRESPPVAGRGMEKPAQVASTSTSATYNVSQTRTGEWAALVGTPSPVTSVLARFKESLSNVQVNLEDLTAKPAAIQAAPPGQKVNGYIRIDLTEAASKAVDVGYIRFFVEKNWLKANNVHKWSVALNRYDTGLSTWMALPTKRIDEDADKVYYSATTPRFSTFAISGSSEPPAPEFNVANLAAGPTPVLAGQPINVSAEVTNLTGNPRNFIIPLWVNNTVESSLVVTVAAGGKAQISYTISRGAGNYDLRVDRQIINLQVNQPTPVATPAPVTTPAATPLPTTAPTTVAPTLPPAPAPVQTAVPTPAATPQPTRPSGPGIPTWLILVGGVLGGAILTGIVIILFILTKRRRPS